MIPSGYAPASSCWDQGTWKPESPDVDAALEKGDLKFTLDGYKLKGSGCSSAPAAGAAAADAPGCVDQAPRRLGGRCRHHRVRTEEREERREFRRHPGRRQSRHLGIAPAGQGWWDAGAMLAKIIERAAALQSRAAQRHGQQAAGQRQAVKKAPASASARRRRRKPPPNQP